MGVFNQRGRCCDCGAEFPLHVSVKRFAGESLPEGEVDIDTCPECGSYSVEDALMILGSEDNCDDTCTVVFRLSKELLDSSDFLYALACRTDGWKGVEILQVQLAKGSSPKSLKRKCGRDRTRDRLDHAVMASDGGQLNPEWVEWLMGWPSGWTGLKPLEMGRYQEWWQAHSVS